MSVGSYELAQGLTLNVSVTLTNDGAAISGGIASDDTITAYIKQHGVRVSQIDNVLFDRTGTDLPNSKIILSFTSVDSATWGTGACEVVIIRNNTVHIDDRWEVIPL